MEILAKVMFCGDGTVGKTSIRRKYLGLDIGTNYLMTIGTDLSIVRIACSLNGTKYIVKTYLQDLAGQPNFEIVRKTYYRGSHAAFLVYDITNRQSFVNIERWANEIKTNNQLFPIPMVLVANKVDLRNRLSAEYPVVSSFEGQELAKIFSYTYYQDTKWDVPYIETSALTGENIQEAFQLLVRFLLQNMLITTT